MNLTVGDIAALVGGKVSGDSSVTITGVNGVDEAGDGDLCFIRNAQYLPQLAKSGASAVLIQEAPADLTIPAILVPKPDLAFAMVLKYCETQQLRHPSGIHPAAVIDPSVMLGANVAVGACAVIEADVQIGDGAIIYAGVYVGHASRIGAGSIIYPNVTIREETEIGAGCIVHAGATLGSDGFGYAPLEGAWMKIPQVGRVVLEDEVEIGSCTSVDRATFGETRIGKGTKIDNLVQIGHNVRIGEHCALAGMVGVAGSAQLRDRVQVGASAGLKGHITVGEGAIVAARSGVVKSVEPGAIVSGFPAIDHDEERRVMVAQRRIPELIRRVRSLERELEALKEQLT
ncbi:MAG: UDP-3-O-(3-hydroxymyristoyl)glucosamine N-acyltransferase [Candidatus Hydrogenedentes bacterium]|nr:UDP-3-O-(3-hydroxymyristoyl)glucosamine N-acyltransferase [Candidatus Hydrogenedentota bacterium]